MKDKGITKTAASILDMKIPDDLDITPDDMDNVIMDTNADDPNGNPDADAARWEMTLVSVDNRDIVSVDNPNIPNITNEIRRIEEGNLQNDMLMEKSLVALTSAYSSITPNGWKYQYKEVEASSALLSIIAEMNRFKVESNMKLIELKMKLQSFGKKPIVEDTPASALNNTFIFNGTAEEMFNSMREIDKYVDIEDDIDGSKSD